MRISKTVGFSKVKLLLTYPSTCLPRTTLLPNKTLIINNHLTCTFVRKGVILGHDKTTANINKRHIFNIHFLVPFIWQTKRHSATTTRNNVAKSITKSFIGPQHPRPTRHGRFSDVSGALMHGQLGTLKTPRFFRGLSRI